MHLRPPCASPAASCVESASPCIIPGTTSGRSGPSAISRITCLLRLKTAANRLAPSSNVYSNVAVSQGGGLWALHPVSACPVEENAERLEVSGLMMPNASPVRTADLHYQLKPWPRDEEAAGSDPAVRPA